MRSVIEIILENEGFEYKSLKNSWTKKTDDFRITLKLDYLYAERITKWSSTFTYDRVHTGKYKSNCLALLLERNIKMLEGIGGIKTLDYCRVLRRIIQRCDCCLAKETNFGRPTPSVCIQTPFLREH